jgi:DNA modification methylase
MTINNTPANMPRCEIEMWSTERLVPYARNPRKNDGAVDRMVASIQEFGFKIPVLARGDGEVVDGHLRLKAAQKLGIGQVPVILCDEWTPAQVKAFRLLVNRSVTWAEWDEDLLAVEFGELKGLDFNLALTGFAPGEVQAGLAHLEWKTAARTEEDAVPPVPVCPVTRPGDVWVLGRHRVLCGDATEVEAVDRLMQGRKADLVFLDPPYNINYDGRGSVGESWLRSRKAKSKRVKKQTRTMLNDHLTDEQFLDFCRRLFGSLRRSVKQSAGIYVCCSDKAMLQFRQAFQQAGFHWSCTVIWAKDRFTLSRGDYQPQHEPILYGWPEGPGHYWCGRRDQGTVWNLAKPRVNELHPTQKPVELIERALENSSRAGDLIVDLCGGSGSTLIACEKTGRAGRLMELDPKYVDVIVERWQDFSGESAALENDGRNFAQVKTERVPAAA